jgi:peptide/nickel transport system ATP-binding protein
VQDLAVDYWVGEKWRNVVSEVSLTVDKGEVVGIVGESGCGKTTLARALMRLLPSNGKVVSGKVILDGLDIFALSPKQFRAVQWDRISMVFQGAMNVLDPVYPVGKQITEAIRTHRRISGKKAWGMAETLLAAVGIDPGRARSYPHELSGGQKQRIGIAMAMALEPDVVVADEPTTALDVVTQDNVLGQLVAAQRENGFSLVIVSHDMGVIAETCDRVYVMYAGHIIEKGPVRTIFKTPAHPYTLGLTNAIPRIGARRRGVSIPGHPPADPGAEQGCRFYDRCPFREEDCTHPVPWVDIDGGHGERCLFPGRQDEFRQRASDSTTWDRVAERMAAVG